ncbi:MAG: aldehyde dehydrogenase family protein [Planctomycetales bacterium]|nr:aldehyde dehydrogenase family protein [Planctomycetales bacterium]
MSTELLARLGIRPENSGVYAGDWLSPGGRPVRSINPSTGEELATVYGASRSVYDTVIEAAQAEFFRWRRIPAPARGELVRQLGNALREAKSDLGLLVSLEVGKTRSEGEGEVQEMIDMCDFAVGQSRQLYGKTMPSERPRHRLFEQWHPLGPVGVLTAFNFPVAVWAWNATLAAVCGDSVIWKPSPHAPLTAIAVQHILNRVVARLRIPNPFFLVVGEGAEPGQWMARDCRLPLVSATGSCEMGRSVGATVASRLGRALLELGGNNAVIVTPSADLDNALRAIVFAAVGTAGQRCTTLRRLIVHETLLDDVLARLATAYESVSIGKPWEDGILMGPLISADAVSAMQQALAEAREQGGEVVFGGEVLDGPGNFVRPAIVKSRPDMPIVARETFAPILYVMSYREWDEAIAIHNRVEQGLSSAVFTDRLTEAEMFLGAEGSDCGIANVNIGTSGAEIGGAFGGEKDTGGGREAGSDAWKNYMRRQTCTINFGKDLPLAQGVQFDLSDSK